ncbi:MAG: TlpA family protein disulfide reductase [Hymenobacteraceae bacterium]|nr:TlpA family protein disulfide reductase [Hymenobacteraceae bacterium]MDX5394930.1 TlpA family protein disulfide reductase [Hymenobacteraceae bacterium]MDX5510963.1 TlpA family protein disulfide reductase [Hymenobacteraceae bacterium]
MNKHTFSLSKVPGWVYTVLVFGFLYLTGLHTEAIAQVQRLMLFTGIMQPDLPESTEKATTEVAGTGFKMQTLDGKTVNFDSLKGKVIFLNIWATWCPPCVAEMPGIQSLYNKVNSDKIAFVMLSVDEGGPAKVKRFIERKNYTFPVYLPAGQLPQEFYSSSIPTTFIISPDGKIVTRHEGMANYDTEEIRNFLLDLAR